MVDTGAQHSVLNQKLGPMSKKTSLVQGATGTKRYCWTTERKVDRGTHQVSHSFLVIQECPAPLLGRDLLTKVNAQIHFDPGGMSVTDGLGQPIHVLSLALRDEHRLFAPKPSETIAPDVQPWVHKYPLAWAETAGMGLAKQRHPVVIELKARATPVKVRQYPMSQEAWRGITPHIINEDTTLQKDDKDGWHRDQNKNLILPATLDCHLCEHRHTTTNLGERKTLTFSRPPA